MYKVPQIWAIHSHRSAKGLSLVTNMAELMLYTVAGSYSVYDPMNAIVSANYKNSTYNSPALSCAQSGSSWYYNFN